MNILLFIPISYIFISFIIGFLIGLPDNDKNIKNSLIMGFIIVFYPMFKLFYKIKGKR